MLVQRKRSVQTTGSRLNQDDDAGPHGEGDVAYAGLVTRTIAIVVDVLLIDAAALAVTGAALLVGSVFSISTKHHEAVWAVIGGATFVLWVIVYFVGFWTTTGQTPGNRLMHISVVASGPQAAATAPGTRSPRCDAAIGAAALGLLANSHKCPASGRP